MTNERLCGGHPLLSDNELDGVLSALFDVPDEGESLSERQELKRAGLKLAVDLMRADQRLPDSLRVWIAAGLLALHDALESGRPTAINDALSDLGRRPKGRPARESKAGPSGEPGRAEVGDGDRTDYESWCDLEIAAAVASMAPAVGKGEAVLSVSVALGVSESSVYRACDEVILADDRKDATGLGGPVTPGLAARVVDQVRLSVRSEPHEHHAKVIDLLTVHHGG